MKLALINSAVRERGGSVMSPSSGPRSCRGVKEPEHNNKFTEAVSCPEHVCVNSLSSMFTGLTELYGSGSVRDKLVNI